MSRESVALDRPSRAGTYQGYATVPSHAALSHMTRLMAADLAPRIRVNGIAVGSVATSALETVLTDDTIRNEMISRTPVKRLGEADDIAIAALYLASDEAAFVTGSALVIDGGWTAK